MSPRVTEAHLEARRREILAAGFHCFARTGLHGTTMQDIADEADLSAGALYRYFESKEALVRALAVDSAGRRAEAYGRLEPGGGADALADLVFEMMGALQTDEGEASVRLDVRLWAEMLDRPEDRELILDAFASVAEPVAAYVRAERKAGRILREVEPEAVGRVVVSLLTGLELQRAYEAGLDLEAYRAAAREMLVGLGSP